MYLLDTYWIDTKKRKFVSPTEYFYTKTGMNKRYRELMEFYKQGLENGTVDDYYIYCTKGNKRR